MASTCARPPSRLLISALCVASAFVARAQSDQRPSDLDPVPWGLSSSASSFRNHAEWFPKMSGAGFAWVRLFPEWSSLEPEAGVWKWDSVDTLVKNAADHKIEINALLMGAPPGVKGKSHAFPMKHLDAWANFVSTVVDRYKDRIRYWEVWNEGNAAFNDDKHNTTDYAMLAATTYTAAKKSDPKAQVGLTVASFDAPYLHQAALAMAKAGKPNHFDYLCIHPYELADGVGHGDGEIAYLGMTRLLRDAIKSAAPERANAPIWITEIGRRIENRGGRTVTEQDAAKAIIKLYVMALAQGIKRVQWFEAQDPAGEDQGFGLLRRDGAARPSYETIKHLSRYLGAKPKYVGWLALDASQRGYGFVFDGDAGSALVAWMPAGETGKIEGLTGRRDFVDIATNKVAEHDATQPFPLTENPVILTAINIALIDQARANAAKPFPWGGDHSAAKQVSITLGKPNGSQGVFQMGGAGKDVHTFPDGSTGLKMKGDLSQSAAFFVHPSFASILTREYHVRVTVRRLGPGNVGMNLHYELADSQGRTPYKNRGEWFGLSKDEGWQTHTWHLKDAAFSKMWGYDFTLRPEQSVPFVLGKVEVSTVPFAP
jgi:polysaccharide biosynthesis protein PslG